MMERGHIIPVPGRPLMPSHPDADAFMRGYLCAPTDVTARLVFADWLEETGRPWNRAWAYYIRLRAEADRHPPVGKERRELEREAAGYASKIRARLTIPAALFVGYPKSLLQLLPGPNITLRLGGFEVPRATLEFMPEAVARENSIVPLDHHQPGVLLVAAADPHNDKTLQRLRYILARDVVVAVRAAADDITAAINRHYGQTDLEVVDSVLIDFTHEAVFDATPAPTRLLPRPLPPSLTTAVTRPIADLVRHIVTEAGRAGAERVRFVPSSLGLSVRYRRDGEWVHWDHLPNPLGPLITARLARMAGVEHDLEVSQRADGEFQLGPDGTVYSCRVSIRVGLYGPAIDLDLTPTATAPR
jgi:type IV pilus assembly protein PilB